MGHIEMLFHQLIDKTDEMLHFFQATLQFEGDIVTQRFKERDLLLKELDEQLRRTENSNNYNELYKVWQLKEAELHEFVKVSMQEVQQKIRERQNANIVTSQYDSYMRQAHHGAFLDKKR